MKQYSHMVRKISLLSVVGSLALAMVVFALPRSAAAAPALQNASSGTGQLTCEGKGVAALVLSGDLQVVSSGAGAIRIANAENIEATGDGKRIDGTHWTAFIGWSGEVNASGAQFGARMVGGNVSFTATGSGTAVVRGNGSCTTESGETYTWTGKPQPIIIAPLE